MSLTNNAQMKHLLLSDTARNAAFLVEQNGNPIFFTSTNTQAREAILSMTTEYEKALREKYGEWATVTREVLADGDELRTCVMKVGYLVNGHNEVTQVLKVVKIPWLSVSSPLFTEIKSVEPEEEYDDQEAEPEEEQSDEKVKQE